MTEVDLPVVFEFVDNVANDTATAVCGHGRVEVDRAMRTVRTAKRVADCAFEGLRTCLAKRRHDAYDLCFAAIAKILAGADVLPANCARRRIKQRHGRLEQLRVVKRDHVSAIPAGVSMSLQPDPEV